MGKRIASAKLDRDQINNGDDEPEFVTDPLGDKKDLDSAAEISKRR